MKTLTDRLRNYKDGKATRLAAAAGLERLQTQLDSMQTHEGKLEDLEKENLRLTALCLLKNNLTAEVVRLTAERDALAKKLACFVPIYTRVLEERDKAQEAARAEADMRTQDSVLIEQLTTERDAYQIAADKMAAERKVECDDAVADKAALFKIYEVRCGEVDALRLAAQAGLDVIRVAFDYYEDVFGLHHNDAVDACTQLQAALKDTDTIGTSIKETQQTYPRSMMRGDFN